MTGSVYLHAGPGCIIIIIDIIWVVLCDDILESDKESFIYFRDKTFFFLSNILRTRANGRHFADDNSNAFFSMKIFVFWFELK